MTKITTQSTLINDQRIAYGIYGEGEPMVLIHGTPSFSYIWRQVLPQLTQSGYKVYIYDLLGYGYSERPYHPGVDTSVTAQTDILIELLKLWHLENAHIVAHDIAGGIAQRLGIFQPQYIKTLTLIDSVSFDSWPSNRTRELMQKGLAQRIQASDADHRQHFSTWLDSAVYNTEHFQQNAKQIYLEMIAGTVGQASLFQHQIRHYDPKHTHELTDRLDELGHLPVQLIWGKEDQWQVVDWAHKLNQAIPGSRLNILDNCGHFAMEDQPEAIAQLIVEFAQQLNA